MDRRRLLQTTLVGVAAATAGCLAGDVVHEVRRQVTVQRGEYWSTPLPSVDGAGAITYSVRASQPFDLYVFTSDDDVAAYEDHYETDAADRTPDGHRALSQMARPVDGRDQYVAATADGGARETYEAESEWYFVVDHTDYGDGVAPGENADSLGAFVDLQVIDKPLPI